MNLYDEKMEEFSVLKELFGYDSVHFTTFGKYILKNPETFQLLINMTYLDDNLVNQFMNDTSYIFMQNDSYSYSDNTPIPKSFKAFNSFFTFFWYTTLPCFDVKGLTAEENGQKALLKYCMWKGKKLPCSSIFKKVTTDQGMCCAFNKPEADKFFVQSEYTSVMKNLQNYDLQNAFENAAIPNWYKIKNEPTSQPGYSMGLTVLLDAHTDLLAEFSIDTDFKGFEAAVIPKTDFPLTFQKGFKVKPGHVNMVALSAVKIDAEDDIQSINPQDRNCLFSNENSIMKLHKQYSQANCLFECALFYAQNMSEACTPWFFPFQDNKFNMCSPLKTQQLIFELENNVPLDACLHCLPDCNQVVYQKSITNQQFRKCDEKNFGMSPLCNLDKSAILPKPQIWGQAVLNQLNGSKFNTSHIEKNIRNLNPTLLQDNIFKNLEREYDAYENDIAILSVFFESSTVLQYATKQSRTWVDFISAVGGNGGLFIGFSIVTLVELIYIVFQLFFVFVKI